MENINWSKYPEDPNDWTLEQKAKNFTDYLFLVALKAEREKDEEREAEMAMI